uniref:Uncharacterized protein n=1 Tax=Rhizophora mucronata TaxID=61149 RepID=A0A2P2QDH0_RHIMU
MHRGLKLPGVTPLLASLGRSFHSWLRDARDTERS